MIVTIGNNEVELYDSMHDLGILRFQRFNKYQMNAMEIGSNFDDYDRRTEQTYKFLQKEMIPEAIQELNNRRMTVFNAFNEYTPTGKALAILVKRINERTFSNYNDDTLDDILKRLDDIGFSYRQAIESLNEVKKKIEVECQVYFPKYFPKNANAEKTALRVRRMNMILDNIIEPNPAYEENLFKTEGEILKHEKPNNWNVFVENNMERTLEVDFHEFALLVTSETGQDLKSISAFVFYSTIGMLESKHAKNKK